jgi:hypothetical protein
VGVQKDQPEKDDGSRNPPSVPTGLVCRSSRQPPGFCVEPRATDARTMTRSMLLISNTSKKLRCDLLLMLYIFAHLTTVMDSSSEFHQLAFAHGATVEGQFLASLAPATRGASTCSCRNKAGTSAKSRASGGGEDTKWHGGVDDSQRFFRVRVRPSHSNYSWRLACSARRAVHQHTHTHDGAGAHRRLTPFCLSPCCPQLHDDDEHTLDYAMETVERVLRQEVVGPHGLVRRARVQWVAYQAHHYGLGLVAVLPELHARRALRDLEKAGLSCSIVPE